MDLPITYRDIRDISIPQKNGTVLKVRRYTFDLGTFGPFVEEIGLDCPDQASELRTRVAARRSDIAQIHL